MRRAQRGAAMLLHGSVTGPIEDATNPIDLEE
jgi:hypothetical protein